MKDNLWFNIGLCTFLVVSKWLIGFELTVLVALATIVGICRER